MTGNPARFGMRQQVHQGVVVDGLEEMVIAPGHLVPGDGPPPGHNP